MRKPMRSIFCLVVVCLVTTANAQEKITLFNGTDLKGWEVFGTEKWYVEDGLLISESGPDKQYGYLGTKKRYKDFELTLEFLQESEGNSGVFFRSVVRGTRIGGWQVEVAPPKLHTGGIYESYGRGWLIKPDPSKEKHLKYGKWNKMKIRAEGGHITTWLNGKQMVDITDAEIAKGEGSICLQIHDGGGIRVKWRKIVLKKL